MAYGNSIWSDIKAELRTGNPVSILIAINVVVFLFLNLVRLISFIAYPDAPGTLFIPVENQFILRNGMALLTHPWTLVTHMFSHVGVLHILFNMLALFWFGRIVKEFSGNRHIWPLYLYGGLAGAGIMFAFYYLFPGLQEIVPQIRALGASAAVNAIILAAATLVPDLTLRMVFIGDVRLKWIALVFVLLNLFQMATNPIVSLAHLGGALMGFVYIRQLRVGMDMAKPFEAIVGFFSSIREKISSKRKPKMVYKGAQKKTNPKARRQDQDKIDAILDKISESGYDSLTAAEKAYLFQRSKED